jgi:hypothetical protein
MEARVSTRRSITITDRRAASYLSDPCKAAFIYPFIGRSRTAGEVAREQGVPLNKMHYRIERLVALGLLAVEREERRAGRSIKHYRATADAFYVPLEATGFDALEPMIDQWSQCLQPLFLRNFAQALRDRHPTWGVRISRERDGRLLVAPAVREDSFYDYFQEQAPSILEGWFSDLRLDDDDAKAFQHDLMGLYLKYLGRGGRRRYLMRVAMTPLADEGALPPSW